MDEKRNPMENQGAGQCPFYEPRFPEQTRDVDSKNLSGVSDLVIFAPIKEGFIDAFGNVTFESRLRIVAEALHKLRKNVREFQLIEPFADPTKRILSLLDFRIGIVDRDLYGFGRESETDGERLRPRKFMFLTATFDGAWEPYMRLIWRPLGEFLDLVLCNCDGYVPSERGYEEYIEWVRGHLLDTAIFYAVSDLTVKDGLYLESVERIHRETADLQQSDLEIATLTTRHPDDEAKQVREEKFGESLKLGMEGLNVLYQLTRYYPPDPNRDGQGFFLHKATHAFLQKFEFKEALQIMVAKGGYHKAVAEELMKTYADPLAWYEHKYDDVNSNRAIDPKFCIKNVQKGIISSYDFAIVPDSVQTEPITNGAVLLLKILDPKKAALLMTPTLWSWETDKATIYRNIAFTMEGLTKLGLTDAELKELPKEFRQGMEERAPLLGDVHHNHPQRWTWPKRNMLLNNVPPDEAPAVAMGEIDIVIQLRSPSFLQGLSGEEVYIAYEDADWDAADAFIEKALGDKKNNEDDPFSLLDAYLQSFTADADGVLPDGSTRPDLGVEGETPIHIVLRFFQKFGPSLGVELLSNQSSFRPGVTPGSQVNNRKSLALTADEAPFSPGENITRDHFGYRDGISQPIIDPTIKYPAELKASMPMAVKRGDILLGHSTMLGDYATQNIDKAILENGSFLAIRRMRQNVGEFDRFLDKNASGTGREHLAAKLMGRDFDGKPLMELPASGPNDFLYSDDPKGTACPFVSHIRRTNPRDVQHGRKAPKIVRRGMSYGAPVTDEQIQNDDPESIDAENRGVLFMAYCASLSEQYETIQRWVNGANSHDIGSAQSDPIFSPLPRDGRSVVRFAEKAASGTIAVRRVERRTTEHVSAESSGGEAKKVAPRPFVQLEWGLYAFAPSKQALICLRARLEADTLPQSPIIDRVEQGRKTVTAIENLSSEALKRREWKILLEDYLVKDPSQHDISPMVWDYLRQEHNGVYRIECGVEGRDEAESEQAVVLVLDESKIDEVLSDPNMFSSEEIGRRLGNFFAPHHIGMDPGERYWDESSATNKIFYEYNEEAAFDRAFEIAKAHLDTRKYIEQTVYNPIPGVPKKFKIELTREFIAPVLAEISKSWFGLPDGTHFETGAWGWDLTLGVNRQARCPGDFLAPSRGAFYPRPTEAIEDYAQKHGARLRQGIEGLVATWRDEGVEGHLSRELDKVIDSDDLLGRNIIGSMIGMLPPMDATMRFVLLDWLDEKTLWQVQGDLYAVAAKGKARPEEYDVAKAVLEDKLKRSMGKRPAPDLLYRTVKKSGVLGGTKFDAGDLVILSLVSATQSNNQSGEPSVDVIFGGHRSGGARNDGGNPHACPAQKMVMGALMGFLTALLTAGRIQALPASLILEISDWPPVPAPEPMG